MLEIVGKLKICRANDIAWLAGYTDYTYCQKGLIKLTDMGLLIAARDNVGAKCYYLTAKGLTEIGKHKSHVYEISYTTNHALAVTKVCAWICAKYGACVFDMVTDNDMKRGHTMRSHRLDIVYKGVAYELELNHKQVAVLAANMLANEQFRKQVWIVPDNKKNIENNLRQAAKKAMAEIEIVKLSQIEYELSGANIHENAFQDALGTADAFTSPISLKRNKYSEYFDALEERQ